MRGLLLAIFIFLSLSATAQDTDSSRSKLQLQFNSPFTEEGDKMRFDLDLPGRRPIQFYVPKMFYAPAPPPYDPEVAWRRSIVLPGWGQYYNRQGWKIPIAYAGYGAAGYFIYSAHSNYKDFQRAYRIRIQRDDQGLQVSESDSLFMLTQRAFESSAPSNLKSQRDAFRRNRDRYILYTIGFHLIQTLDAYIAAHLKDLDFSDDLSLRIEPGVIRGSYARPGVGMGLTLRF